MKTTAIFLTGAALCFAFASDASAQTLRPVAPRQPPMAMPQRQMPTFTGLPLQQAQAQFLHQIAHVRTQPFVWFRFYVPFGTYPAVPYMPTYSSGYPMAAYAGGYGMQPSFSASGMSYSGGGYGGGYGGQMMPSNDYGATQPYAASDYKKAFGTEASPKDSGNSAVIAIKVPLALADVLVDGNKMEQTGVSRTFVTTPIAAGKTVSHTVQANWSEEGWPQSATRQVQVSPGQTVYVDFTKKQ